MEIKASCVLNLESCKALARLSVFQRSDPKKRMIFWTVVYALLAAVIVAQLLWRTADPVLYWCLGLLVFCYLLVCFFYFVMPRLQFNAMANMKDAVNTYTFYDNAFCVTTTGAAFGGNSELQYSMLVKAMETSRYFFIFGNKTQVLLVDKATITGGTPLELREKLQGQLGSKYIICKY